MPNDHEIYFTHTEPCYICRGAHDEYRNRPCCRNCESLQELMKRGLISRPPSIINPLPTKVKRGSYKLTPEQHQEIRRLRLQGLTISEIADHIGVANRTVEKVLKRGVV